MKRYIYPVLTGLMFYMNSCIMEGAGEGCGTYIRFIYDYNMAFEDLFHHQASKADLFLFDENDIFITRLSEEYPQGTFPRNHTMKLPDEWADDPVQIIAWVGLYEETYLVTEMIPGVSRKEELLLQINKTESNSWNNSLQNLWYGSVRKASTQPRKSDEYIDIPLIKNTNHLRMVLYSLDEDLFVDVNDFSFSLESVNGKYNHINEPFEDDICWNYKPFYTRSDSESGAIAELETMRLMEDRMNRLLITYLPQQDTLVDTNLNKYIYALKLQEYMEMSLQEYMDREDEFRVIVLLRTIEKPDGSRHFVATNIQMNNWTVRDQDEDLELPLK